MANIEQAEILNRGAAEWNKWRQKNRTVYPDLVGITLPYALLDEVNLENANLLEANFQGASLARANLRNTNLKDARLRRATLRDANLTEVNLYGADLREADLTFAILCQTNMRQVKLDEARLDFAVFGGTGFDETILSAGESIGRVVHRFPSNVDVKTLERTARYLQSQPGLRTVIEWFYRGVGIPDDLIDYHLARTGGPREFCTCFLSYSHSDDEFARLVWGHLQKRGIYCWKDEKEIIPGIDLRDTLTTAIIRHDRVLLCCSEHSLTSNWVETEISLAFQKERLLERNVLLPLDIDGYLRLSWGSPLASPLSQRLIADFVGWRESRQKLRRELQRVVQALQYG